jgi:hypothetical protein
LLRYRNVLRRVKQQHPLISFYMCPHRSWFKGLRSRERTDILLGDDSNIACDSEGRIHPSMVFRGKNIRFCLDNVLFTPGLKHMLSSCSALASAGYQALFTAAHCSLTHCKAQGGPETIARMRPRNGIYYVPAVAKVNKRHDAHLATSEDNNNGDSSDSTNPAAQLAHSEIVDRWHCRLSHAGRDRVRETANCTLSRMFLSAMPVFAGSIAATVFQDPSAPQPSPSTSPTVTSPDRYRALIQDVDTLYRSSTSTVGMSRYSR